jgi:hemoglobin-like flavoprotein
MKFNPTQTPQAITPQDVVLLQESFRSIRRQSGPASDRFFRELFSYDASLKQLFVPDRWRREEVLMEALGGMVNNFNAESGVGPHLIALAREHPAYGLSNYHHLYFGAALFSMLEMVLGSRFKVVYGAWFKLFQLLVGEVKAQAGSVALATERNEPAFAHATAA